MPASAEALVPFLEGQGSFGLSFLVGAIVIALYARKRIEEFSVPPRGEEYDFTKMLAMNDIVGSKVFYKSYVFYVLLLEFLYFFACTSKPIILLMSGDKPGATFQGAAWPLGAALLVVGLLPSTPAVAQLEAMLRGLAQRVANIPSEFFERVSKLSRSEIESLVEAAPGYKPEMRRFWRIQNVLASLGFAADDARLMARSCISAELFGQWTISGDRFWNAEEFEKYRGIVSVLRPKTELLRKEVEALLSSSQKIEHVSMLWQKHNVTEASLVTPDVLDSIAEEADGIIKAMPETPVTEQEIRQATRITAAVDGWKKLARESEVTARRLSALFAIMARNDRQAVRLLRLSSNTGLRSITAKPDPVIARLIELLEDSRPTQIWSNAAIVACLAGAVWCVVLLSAYFHLVEAVVRVRGASASQVLFQVPLAALRDIRTTDVVRDSLFTSVTLLASFCLASLVALFLRSVKIDDDEWSLFTSFRRIPFANYYQIIFWSSLAAFMPLVISWILYYYDPGQGDVGAISSKTPAAIAEALIFRFLVGFTAVTYAIGTCIIADVVEAKASSARSYSNKELCLRLAIAVVTIEVVCLIVNPVYTFSSGPFWSNVVAVLIFSYAALRSFLSSYEAYRDG